MTTAIDYHFSLSVYDVNDGVTVPYFVAHKFNTAQLVVPDTGIYSNEINKIKAMGIPNVIVDVEQPIWAGGQNSGVPIANFANYFQQLKNIGVTRVSTEGGRDGDFDFMGKYFGLVNYNCDQCGLWKSNYKHPKTVLNSWESYYTSEWGYIQTGVKAAAPLGIKNGILAGVWGGGTNPILANSVSGSGFTFFDEAAWIDANGGLDHFAVWGGLNNGMLARYKSLGFEQIVAKMQLIYPPRGTVVPPTKVGFQDVTTCVGNCDHEFAWGSNGSVYHKSALGESWESLGGVATSAPVGLARPGGLLDVFVRGSDGGLWQKSQVAGSWGKWVSLKGQLYAGTRVNVCSRDGVTIEALVLGADKQTYRKKFNGTAWSADWSREDTVIG
jgi:hypothetical protein